MAAMEEPGSQSPDATIRQLDALVDPARVPSVEPVDEPYLAVRPPTAGLHPSSQEVVPTGDAVRRHVRATNQKRAKLGQQLRRGLLVRVHEEDPVLSRQTA